MKSFTADFEIDNCPVTAFLVFKNTDVSQVECNADLDDIILFLTESIRDNIVDDYENLQTSKTMTTDNRNIYKIQLKYCNNVETNELSANIKSIVKM